jgi:polar amino acid transport system substrate-binding protein
MQRFTLRVERMKKMQIRKKLNSRLDRLPIQVILVVLIVLAMVEFISVSVIIVHLLDKLNINSSDRDIRIFMTKIAGINISMIILFILIVKLLSKLFKKINSYAYYNCTTGLPNKNYMMNKLVNETVGKRSFSALISLDIDDFKAVNDALGHLAGDELLKQAGERFEKLMKKHDCVCHIGGDEFMFFLKSVKTKDETEKMAEAILDSFTEPFYIEESIVDYVSASLGIALMPNDGIDFQTLYNCSDDAMFMAKKRGKSAYLFYETNMSLHLYEDSIKKKDIKEGILKKEFKAFYQPKYSSGGQLIGAEALARWVKEDGTVLPPSEFIEFAEKNGLILAITDLIVDEVCKDIISWEGKWVDDVVISINITSAHISDKKLIKKLIERINFFNIPTKYLEFEITESMVIEDFKKAQENIALLKSCGIKISMDDFGTGYSSLNYLKALPIDIIKIDKSFIDSIYHDQKDRILLQNIIHIAHGFDLTVIAEGVENEEQLNILQDMKCDMFQGYYFSKPIKKDDFETMFLAEKTKRECVK